jgi:hypothetical protein
LQDYGREEVFAERAGHLEETYARLRGEELSEKDRDTMSLVKDWGSLQEDLLRTNKGEASDASHKTLVAPEPGHIAGIDGYAAYARVVRTETAISLFERPARPNLLVHGL